MTRPSTPSARRSPLITAAGAALATLAPAAAAAHTEPSAVAVPALAEATVAFQPEHGCGDAPTTSVLVRAPVEGAVPAEVEGWTATATPDGTGNTVLEWSGGLLPADEAGSFPVELTVPDVVGTLLAFPAIQRCADGTELAWIGLTPGDQYPAPQVLVLPVGSEPAATIEDVPADAPGREQLVALAAGVVDDDAGTPVAPVTATPVTPPPPTVPPTSTPSGTAAPTAPTPATAGPTDPATTTDVAPTAPATTVAGATGADGGGGSATGWIIGAAVVAVVGGGAAVLLARRRGDAASA